MDEPCAVEGGVERREAKGSVNAEGSQGSEENGVLR